MDDIEKAFGLTKEKIAPAVEFIERIESIYVIWHIKAGFVITNASWHLSNNKFTDIDVQLKAIVDESYSKLEVLEEIGEVVVLASRAGIGIDFNEETDKKISYVMASAYPRKRIYVRIEYKFLGKVSG